MPSAVAAALCCALSCLPLVAALANGLALTPPMGWVSAAQSLRRKRISCRRAWPATAQATRWPHWASPPNSSLTRCIPAEVMEPIRPQRESIAHAAGDERRDVALAHRQWRPHVARGPGLLGRGPRCASTALAGVLGPRHARVLHPPSAVSDLSLHPFAPPCRTLGSAATAARGGWGSTTSWARQTSIWPRSQT